MAKYQKEFLINYFRDISALQLALHKLQGRLTAMNRQKQDLENGFHSGECPLEPRYEASNGVFSIGLGGYLFMTSISMFVFKLYFLGLFCVLMGVLTLMVGVIRYVKVNRENDQKEARYNRKLAAYQEIQKKKDHAKKSLPQLEKDINQCQLEIQRLQEALHGVYESGIIPEQYQDLHTALFLYIWFQTGKASNLDVMKNILMDDQIKQKLDLFIANKQESILKQYLHFTKKLTSPEALKKYTHKLEAKLEQAQVPQEDHEAYLAMLQGNALTAAFFANASYIRHL